MKGDYCAAFGDALAEDSDELILMEANDNHVEHHTVGEFVAWCINGREDESKSGKWESKGTGKYLEGGKAAGGQLTDQRFCGRILKANCVSTWSTTFASVSFTKCPLQEACLLLWHRL